MSTETRTGIIDKKARYQNMLNEQLNEIEGERHKAAVDAQTALKQNKATYGANAEKLLDMGLTGSGYSDYLNSQAYAQERASITAANLAASTAKMAAESTYGQYIADADEALNTNYASLLSDINENGSKADIDSIKLAYDTGNITQTQYKDLQEQYRKIIDTNNTVGTSRDYTYDGFVPFVNFNTNSPFYTKDGDLLSKESAEKKLAEIYSSEWYSEATKADYKRQYDEMYGSEVIHRGVVNKTGSAYELGEKGNNYSVEYKGEIFDVESAGVVSDPSVLEAAERGGVGFNEVFAYMDELYIRQGETIYKIRAKPTDKNSYNVLKKRIYGQDTTALEDVGNWYTANAYKYNYIY